jgi:hypothetical protein
VEEEAQTTAPEPLLQCTYGLYRRRKLLQLYADVLQLDNQTYELADLLSIEPSYHLLFNRWFAHISFYFREQDATAHFITDQEILHTMVLYLSHYHDLVRTGATSALYTPDDLAQLVQAHASDPDYQLDLSPARSLVRQPFPTAPHYFTRLLTTLPALSPLPATPKTSQERFWRYDSSDSLPTASTQGLHASSPDTPIAPTIAPPETITTTAAPSTDPTDPPRTTPIIYNADPAWPWLDEDQRRRAHRLKSLQVEREQRLHGFDVEAFAKRLSTEPLQPITVPLRLHPAERAYYCVDASLCAEPLRVVRHSKRRYSLKDHGKLILTDQRIIYLGRKRQIVVTYNHLLQVVQLPDAMAVFAEYWAKRQYFAMQRPLACVMYLNRLLRDYQQTLSPENFLVRTCSDEDDQATIVIDKKKLLHTQQT